nr:MAG TPA: hypothetical protein [Caudoviricetes sp.]
MTIWESLIVPKYNQYKAIEEANRKRKLQNGGY